MEALTLLLIFFTLPGYSYVLQPKSSMVMEKAVLDKDHQAVLRDVFISAEERENLENRAAKSTDGVSSETNPARTPVKKEKTVEERREDGLNGDEILDRNQGYERGSEERMTAETFSKSINLRKETKRGEYKVEDLDREVVEEKREDGLNLVPNPEIATHDKRITVKTMSDKTKNWKIVKTVKSHNPGRQKEAKYDETDGKFKKIDQMVKLRQEKVKEERESQLVAGISFHEETRGDMRNDEKILTIKQEVAEKGGNEERDENSQQILTHSQNPPSSPPPHRHHHNVPPPFPSTPTQVGPASSFPPTTYANVTPQFFPPAVTIPNPTVSTAVPVEVSSVSLLEDLLIEVLQSPGHHLKQNQLEVKASPNLEDEMDKNMRLKPARKELQTTHKAQEINTVGQPESESTPKVQAATPKPKEAKFINKDLNTKELNPTPKSNENISMAKLAKLTHKPNMTQPTGRSKTVKLVENDSKLAVKQNKASLPKPQLTKPSAKPQLTTAKTPLTKPTKINRGRKNKTKRKSKEKKRKKDNKTQKATEKKEDTTPTHFPYFMDNYCPPECACYGRVVQCSDKGVDRVPYGIPYNARYILLMNNNIDSIQLDLLSEYVSMEFLVLSNNRLTDGAIEGAFEGVPALRRLYLDRNLLESVPTDLPVSLEELRLDNNQLGVMSEAAWARCPGLLVLSLSNNSLGNGSESLPNAVLSPLFNLQTLNLAHNQLTSVPQGLPLSIKELYLKGNLIEQFRGGAFNGVSELLVLDLSANRLTNKGLLRESLLNATHLESLNLEGNRLKQVPRHLPRSLKTLNLEGNLISSIKKTAFSSLINLEHLGLARNKIFKVAVGAFKTLPILHQLDLSHNTLHQVPRQLPQGLHSLAFTHNKIQSVPRDAFCWGDKSLTLSRLIRVQLEHNLIDMGKLDAQAFRCLRGFQVVHFY